MRDTELRKESVEEMGKYPDQLRDVVRHCLQDEQLA